VREVDYSPTPTAEVRNVWTYTSTRPYAFMVLWLINDMKLGLSP